MMHTLKLDDMELTALITHLEGQSEMMVESRLKVVTQVNYQIEKKCYLILYMQRHLQSVGNADKNPKVDFDLIKNQDRIYQYKMYPQVYG